MARAISYHIGGYLPDHPSGNVSEQWDTKHGYQSWNEAGEPIAARPLSDEERQQLKSGVRRRWWGGRR